MTVKVGVCLSGCGVFDGAEIQEAVFTLLALDQAGAAPVCMAPDLEFAEVNHRTGKATGAKRRVLDESARICRGEIRDIGEVKSTELDALIFPGGFGAAKNLSNFALAGAEANLDPAVARLAREMQEAGKPLGAICIAPALLALLFKGRLEAICLTIGNDRETAKALEILGAKHEARKVTEICVDQDNKLVTTPAYMLGTGPAEVFTGIGALVRQVLAMIS